MMNDNIPPTQPATMLPAPRSGRFGKGWKPDYHDKSSDRSARTLLGAQRHHGLPIEVSMRGRALIKNQRETSACVAFALAQAVFIRCAVMGKPIPWPSTQAIYDIARAMEREGRAFTALADEGSVPANAVAGLMEWGCPSESAMPFDPATVNKEPDLAVLEAASAFEVHGTFRVNDDPPARAGRIRQALANGYPVPVGTMVDDAFEAYDGAPGSVVSAPDLRYLVGGHMTCIVGYDSKGRFLVANSWDFDYGDQGFFWADESWVASDEMSDIYLVTCSPK